MHDCLKTQEKLLDLILHEIELPEQTRVLAEAATCSLCQAELESFEKTLLLYDNAAALNEPTASEWQNYERNLREQFMPLQTVVRPFWKRILTTSILVPAPVLAAMLIMCVGLFFALRSIKSESPRTTEAIQIIPPDPSPNPTPEKIFVREERVVTRKIYVAKQSNQVRQASATKRQKNLIETNLSPLNLAEFKPVRPFSPSFIKGNKPK